MGHPLPTFSSLDRAKVCPGSFALPWTARVTKYSDKGHAIHAFVLSKKRGDENLPEVPEQYRALCESIDLAKVPTGKYEVSFGLDVSTGMARCLGENLNREYPKDLRANEVIGTADIFDRIKSCDGDGGPDMVYVGDVKTGLAEHVPPVRENLQLAAAAVAAARVEKVDSAVVATIKIRDDGMVWIDTVVLDRWALDAVELEIQEIVRSVRTAQEVAESGGRPKVVTGDHCKFCPAFADCPAKRDLAMLLADPKALDRAIMGALTPESAPHIYQKYREAKEVLTRIGSILYGYAEQQPFSVGGGKVLGPVTVVTRKIEANKAHDIMLRDFGSEAAAEVVEWKTSKKAIRGALRKFCKYGTLLRTEQQILTELQMTGGLKLVERTEVKPHREGIEKSDAEDED